MRKVSLFIAMSLDGYIADDKGKVDWLAGQDQEPVQEEEDAYTEFIQDVDTVIMGWNTYHQIVTELSPDQWVYGELTTYVVTHREEPSQENIRFVHTDPVKLVERLRTETGKGIWICGGANLVRQLAAHDVIDCYDITIIPTLLGSGVRLFENGAGRVDLRLLRTRSYHGMTNLVYVRR